MIGVPSAKFGLITMSRALPSASPFPATLNFEKNSPESKLRKLVLWGLYNPRNWFRDMHELENIIRTYARPTGDTEKDHCQKNWCTEKVGHDGPKKLV